MKTTEAATLVLLFLITIGLIWASKTEPCQHAAAARPEPVVARSCEMSGRAPDRVYTP